MARAWWQSGSLAAFQHKVLTVELQVQVNFSSQKIVQISALEGDLGAGRRVAD